MCLLSGIILTFDLDFLGSKPSECSPTSWSESVTTWTWPGRHCRSGTYQGRGPDPPNKQKGLILFLWKLETYLGHGSLDLHLYWIIHMEIQGVWAQSHLSGTPYESVSFIFGIEYSVLTVFVPSIGSKKADSSKKIICRVCWSHKL